MKVSLLDLHCLNAMADDYETVRSIMQDVRHSTHGNVDEADITTCVAELMRDGMADAYRLDEVTGEFAKVPAVVEHIDGLWFHITDRGRRQLDENWVED